MLGHKRGMALSPQWLDELKSRITLSALVMRTTKLQRAGREWKACCPFHSEKSPSFYVNDQKGFYHCFGCQQHGGAIDWMMEQHGLSFMDAVKELAAEAGMEVPAPDPRAAERAEQRATLHDVMAAAQEWFVARLWSAEGMAAREYLQRRGLNEHTVRRFGFGWAPDDKLALKQALSQFDEALLVEAGLLIAVDEKLPYSRFRGRVMLPIQDTRERVIAFGGRILESRANDSKGGVAKYLNSPDTPLFDKGRTLYNLHRAAAASRKSGRVVVAEGYMDVIALAAAGIEDAVAPMGTALTEAQIELLWRMADKPVLCFDGDAAGQRAAMRAAERALPMLRPGHSLRVVTLPAGLDPDDLIRRDGAKAMERLLGKAIAVEDYGWNFRIATADVQSPAGLAQFKAQLEADAELIKDPNIRRDVLARFMSKFYALRRSVNDDFSKRQGKRSPEFRRTEALTRLVTPALQFAVRADNKIRALQSAVLHGLARHPGEVHRHADALLTIAKLDAQMARAVDFLLDAAGGLEPGNCSPISAPDILPPSPDKSRFSFLGEGCDPGDAREDLAEAIALLVEKPALEAAIAAATRRFDADPEGAFAEQQRLRKRKLEIDSRLGQMARKRAAAAASEQDTTAPDPASAAEQETE